MQALGDGAQVEPDTGEERGDIAADRAEIMLDADVDDFDEGAVIIVNQDVGRADLAAADIEPVVGRRGGVGDFRLADGDALERAGDVDGRRAVDDNGEVRLDRGGAGDRGCGLAAGELRRGLGDEEVRGDEAGEKCKRLAQSCHVSP